MESDHEDLGGEVFTWGSGEMGQLGFSPIEVAQLPKDSESFPYQPFPVPIKTLSGYVITQVAGGDGHSLAVTSNGRVYSWGASACGQLGLSDIDQMPKDSEGYPYHPEPRLIEGLLDFKIVLVSCGDAHTAALTSEGIVLTWGGGGCGQLGHPDTLNMPKDDDGCPFQPEPRIVDSLNVSIKHISCGKAHTVAISEEGLMYTWGAGACGQLGHPDTSVFPLDEDGYPYHPVPKLVSALRAYKLKMAACGDVHTLALSEEGSLYCFGGGSFGQLGLGNIKNLPVDVDDCPFMPIPKQIETLKKTKISYIACGDSHSMAVTVNGELYGWGAAACGQLGIEDTAYLPKDQEESPYEPLPRLITELKGKIVTSVACGEAHTLVLTDRGVLYSFGASSCGQLGLLQQDLTDNTKRRIARSIRDSEQKSVNYQPTPKLISQLLSRKVLAIACGGVHNIVIAEPSPQSLAADLYSSFKQGLFTDVNFVFKFGSREEIISCHKIVLASRSDYFKELLKNTSTIEMTYSKEAFSKVIEYIYLDDMEILLETISSCKSYDQVVELLELANNFKLTELQKACQAHLMQILRPYIPDPLPIDHGNNLKGLIFLPDGRAAILPSAAYQRMLTESIMLDTRDQNSPEVEPRLYPLGMNLLKELNSPEFSDVTLIVEGKPIYAHRVIIAAQSQYFSALYSHGFREAREGIVEIGDVTYNGMMNLLRYCYSDELQIDLDTVLDLFTLCERFSVPGVKQRGEFQLVPSLSVERAAQLFKHAKNFQCGRLKEICLVYIEEHFNQVIGTQAFEDLDKDSILEIMRFNKCYR